MEFDTKKFKAIRFAEVFGHSYYANDKQEPIDHLKLIKDIGIDMWYDMKFDQHNRIVRNKGKRKGGWILRVFASTSPTIMLILLKQLILFYFEILQCTLES